MAFPPLFWFFYLFPVVFFFCCVSLFFNTLVPRNLRVTCLELSLGVLLSDFRVTCIIFRLVFHVNPCDFWYTIVRCECSLFRVFWVSAFFSVCYPVWFSLCRYSKSLVFGLCPVLRFPLPCRSLFLKWCTFPCGCVVVFFWCWFFWFFGCVFFLLFCFFFCSSVHLCMVIAGWYMVNSRVPTVLYDESSLILLFVYACGFVVCLKLWLFCCFCPFFCWFCPGLLCLVGLFFFFWFVVWLSVCIRCVTDSPYPLPRCWLISARSERLQNGTLSLHAVIDFGFCLREWCNIRAGWFHSFHSFPEGRVGCGTCVSSPVFRPPE